MRRWNTNFTFINVGGGSDAFFGWGGFFGRERNRSGRRQRVGNRVWRWCRRVWKRGHRLSRRRFSRVLRPRRSLFGSWGGVGSANTGLSLNLGLLLGDLGSLSRDFACPIFAINTTLIGVGFFLQFYYLAGWISGGYRG